ncbi:MAG: redoxin domain-containing protein [Gemmataceae bacterium]
MIRASLILAVFVLAMNSVRAEEPKSPLGRKVDNFTLKDYRGAVHTLDQYKDQKLIVLAFLGTECPLVKLYGPRLEEVQKQFADRGVVVLGINANVHDSVTEMAAYARIHKLSFPILKDLGNVVADQLGAQRTPEVFLLDSQRKIRYHGRVDDQYGIGYVRDEPKRRDLNIAIQELLDGKAVSEPELPAPGCHIGRVKKPTKDATVTYSKQIARILQNHCVECHRTGEIAPFALTEYSEVAGWAEMIAEVVREQRMPPWHADSAHGKFKNARRLSDEDKKLIHDWVAAGAPEGDKKDLPEPRQFTTGWQLPKEPDLVVNVSPQPFKVPAGGTLRYQYFRVDPGFKEDKWLAAAELLPGNRAVVHHILAFARPKGGRAQGGAVQGFLVGYVPGMRVQPYPKGMAKRVPAGSELVFQVHYTPIGSEQLDQSKLGLIFAEPASITHEVWTTGAANTGIRIPAQAGNHREEAWNRRPLDECQLLAFMPHMHLRGKSITYEAIFPDGKKETLLNVPQWDFNWQSSYHLAEPRKLPRGTRMHVVAHYDNSENNLSNPDPKELVRWGDQTWEEMLIGYFDIAVPRGQEPVAVDDNSPQARARDILQQYDANKDGKIQRTEVPENLKKVFDLIDRNKDEIVTEEELITALKARLLGR